MTEPSPSQPPLELASVPQLGPFLVEKKLLTEASLKALNEGFRSQRNMFVGEVIVALGLPNEQTKQPFTANELVEPLNEQLKNKMTAIVADIAAIARTGSHPVPVWLKANWGNDGVNKAQEKPTVTDGISAVVNIAQNLVMTVNSAPDAAQTAEKFTSAIEAAHKLALSMDVKSNYRADLAQIGDFLKVITEGLLQVPEPLVSNQSDRTISMADYIAERSKEIRGALRQLGLEPPSQTREH